MADERNEDDPPLIPHPTGQAERRINSIIRFTRRQRRERRWINLYEIAEWYAERGGRFDAAELDRALEMLWRDLFFGDFEEDGRSQVRYFNPNLREEKRMARAFLHKITRECTDRETVHLHLSWCWIPRRLFERWLENHRLQASPARFEPQEDAVVSDEERAIKALAAYLKQMPDCRRDDAAAWCRQRGHTSSDRSFRSQIWPVARKLAGLPGKASPGRKPKPK